MLKHASTTSSTAAAVATSTLLGGQLLRTAANSSSNINCNGNGNGNNSNCNSNSNTNSSSSNNQTGSGGSGHNTPPVPLVEAEAGIGIGNGIATTSSNNGGSPTPAAAAVASTARNIHLRPPQPLNISALNASASSTLLTEGGSGSGSGGGGGGGGGHRGCLGNSTTLLNIATPSTPLKPLTPLTPLTQLTPNGHFLGNGSVHHHTYTNQHILASSGHQQQSQQQQQQQTQTQQQQLPHAPAQTHNLSQVAPNYRNYSHLTPNPVRHKLPKSGPSPREALTSLGLLCLISLLLALLSLIFLLRISPNGREDAVGRGAGGEDFIVVYDVTLALGALSLSLNLCCLLVCAIQFLFAVKLREPAFEGRENQYLAKSSASRTCAVSGFFISIPVFLTGLILYTFSHFHSTPAIVTSLLIGVGIVFCGGAMVHNVFVWQREKTISYRGGAAHSLSVISAAQLPVTLPMPLPLPLPLPLPPGPYHGYHQGGNHLVPPSVTAVSPNHSHGSFNPLLLGGGNGCCGGGGGGAGVGAVNSSFLVRPATATPPTPTPRTLANSSCLTTGREASGSVSPGIPPTLDMSNITVLLHELSTLV